MVIFRHTHVETRICLLHHLIESFASDVALDSASDGEKQDVSFTDPLNQLKGKAPAFFGPSSWIYRPHAMR